MLSFTAVPNEAATKPVESHPVPRPLTRLDWSPLDVEVNINKLLTRLYADLQAVEDAIQALELISPDSRSKRLSRAPKPTAQIPKTNNVVDIHTTLRRNRVFPRDYR